MDTSSSEIASEPFGRGWTTAAVTGVCMGTLVFARRSGAGAYGVGAIPFLFGLFVANGVLAGRGAAAATSRLSGSMAIPAGANLLLTFLLIPRFGLDGAMWATAASYGLGALASLLLGVGVGFAFASMANLIVEAVRPDQTGVATGMNAVMRTIGGAIGGQVAASILSAHLLADGVPAVKGYTISFALMAVALGASIVASLAVPGGRPHRVHRVPLTEPQASFE